MNSSKRSVSFEINDSRNFSIFFGFLQACELLENRKNRSSMAARCAPNAALSPGKVAGTLGILHEFFGEIEMFLGSYDMNDLGNVDWCVGQEFFFLEGMHAFGG